MQVKGFQVAPAEVEGCILDHPDVSNICVVGVPDEYSKSCAIHIILRTHHESHKGGEIPLAFVSLTADAAKRASKSKASAEEIKASIMKVSVQTQN